MTQNLCTPQPIYGPYRQTVFLGCSVLSFSATAGWNGQSSEVTVDLAQDTCESPEGTYKEYWSNVSTIFPVAQQWTGADPGFTYPNIGAPAYFRVADFEYSGIIQGWTIKEDESGKPVYNVKLTDPRAILDHVQVILDNYEGNTTLSGLYNLLNVYAYLEYTSGDCQDRVVQGTGFGAPALGFGGARRTDRGLPWDLIKGAIQDLAGSNAGTPNARYSQGGLFYREGSGRGWGELNFSNYNHDDTARYIIDLEEVPNSYTWDYRIAGPVVSLGQLIDQVCQDAGCDYYVELLPTVGTLIIKVRTISRTTQPTLGESTGDISTFISAQKAAYGVVGDSFGRELRAESNSSFVIGAKARQYYEEETYTNIAPFWGWDTDGNVIEWLDDTSTESSKQVKLDFRQINLALNNPVSLGLIGGAFGWVGENELRWVLGDKTTFEAMITSPAYPSTVLSRYYKETCGVSKAGGAKLTTPPGELTPADLAIGVLSDEADPTNPKNLDRQTLFNWLSSYASEFYGKQFLVKVPYICTDLDPDTGERIFSDLPSTEGGWASLLVNGGLSDNPNVLNIANPSLPADRFKDDVGKFQPILKYTTPYSNTDSLGTEEYLANPNSNEVWVKADIEPEWVETKGWFGSSDTAYAALLKISSPVFNQLAALARNMAIVKASNIKPMGPIVPNPEYVNANTKDFLAGLDPTTGAMSPPAAWPTSAGVPVASNTRTYGPWYSIGANPGAVHCEVDDGLAPWEYGGLGYMNAAGTAKVYNASTSMQIGERGEVTVPGYPTISLGSALLANPPNSRFDGRTVGFSMHVYPRGPWSYNYTQWALGQETTGASVSSINVSVAAGGVTTSYTVSTFTPVFGRFSKGNAERVKQIGLNRLRAERERRANNALKRLLKASQNRSIKVGTQSSPQNPNSAMMLFAGKLAEDKKRKIVVGADKNTLSYYGDYDNTSMISMDGFFRPVSNYGDADLPKVATNSGSCLLTQTEGPPPPVSGYSGLPILQKYLDFLADPVSNTTLLDDARANSSTSGHDVESVARKDLSWLEANQPSGATSMLINLDNQQSYAEDYRYLAMRGPMMMQSWGYDLHGKPIPNEVGDSATSFQNSYVGLKDTFKENWLSDARDWPLAPIDLRFDRKRGVWTVPSAFRLYQVKAKDDISPGEDGEAEIIKYKTDIVDADGSTISTPTISIENWTDSVISGDQKTLAYYDTVECKYWAIPAFSGDGGIGIGCNDTAVPSCVSPLSSIPIYNKKFITFGKNLNAIEVSVDGKDGIIVSATGTGGSGSGVKIGSVGDCIDAPLACETYECLKFSDGLSLSIDGTDAIVKGPQIASQGLVCGVDGIAATEFTKLTFRGPEVTEDEAACNYTVHGPKITWLKCLGGADADINGQYFTELQFKGFNVKAVDGGKCAFTISGPQIKNTLDCNAPAPQVYKNFDKLAFGGGLNLSANAGDGDCAYVVNGPQIAEDGTCDHDTLASTSAYRCPEVEPAYFDKLTFGAGLCLTKDETPPEPGGNDKCNYTVVGPKIVSLEGMTCDAKVEDPASFATLVVGKSLTVKSIGDATYGQCAYVIEGPTISANSRCGDDIDAQAFSNITFEDRLTIASTTPEDSESSSEEGGPGCFAGVTISGPPLTVGNIGPDVTTIKMAGCGDVTTNGKKLGPLVAVNALTNSDDNAYGVEGCDQTVKIGTVGVSETFDVVVSLSCSDGSMIPECRTLTFCGGLLTQISESPSYCG